MKKRPMGRKRRKKDMKKTIIAALLCLTLAAILCACGGSSEPASETEEPAVTEEVQAPESAAIVLSWNDPGEYGKEISLNSGDYIGFFLPAGTYTVTNNDSSVVQVSVYKDGFNTTEEGWDEPIMGDASPIVVMQGETGTITVGENEYVKLSDGNSNIVFEAAA